MPAFLEPLAQQVWFSDALYKGFLIRNDIEWVLWEIILRKNTSLYFGSFGSENEGPSLVSAISKIRWPCLSHLASVGLRFLWFTVGIIVIPSSLPRLPWKPEWV